MCACVRACVYAHIQPCAKKKKHWKTGDIHVSISLCKLKFNVKYKLKLCYCDMQRRPSHGWRSAVHWNVEFNQWRWSKNFTCNFKLLE